MIANGRTDDLIDLLHTVLPGRSRNLAGDSPAGERGRPGRHHCSFSQIAGARSVGCSDGLLLLPEFVGCSPDRTVRFTQADGVVDELAGAFRRRLLTRTYEQGAGGGSTSASTGRRRYERCVVARNARSSRTVKRTVRRKALAHGAPLIVQGSPLLQPTLCRKKWGPLPHNLPYMRRFEAWRLRLRRRHRNLLF
jgi:hypothetical protein